MTLLEVVLVVWLLTAVVLGTMLLLVPIARQSRINRETEIANAAAQRVLEQLHATPFLEIVDAYPPGTERPVTELENGRLVVDYADAEEDPLQVDVTLTWSSPELGEMEVVFNTVRTE